MRSTNKFHGADSAYKTGANCGHGQYAECLSSASMMFSFALASLALTFSSLPLLVRCDEIANLTQAILTALESNLDCAGCQNALLPPLQTLAVLGDAPLVDVLTGLCIQ